MFANDQAHRSIQMQTLRNKNIIRYQNTVFDLLRKNSYI